MLVRKLLQELVVAWTWLTGSWVVIYSTRGQNYSKFMKTLKPNIKGRDPKGSCDKTDGDPS
jgi:hypothetical protein